MQILDEARTAKAILETYHQKLLSHIACDVIVVGAGSAGPTAVFGRIPQHSHDVYEEFWRHPGRDRVYRFGSHPRRKRNFIDQVVLPADVLRIATRWRFLAH